MAARQLVFDGKADQATKLINDQGMSNPKKQLPYQTLGDLKLTFRQEPAKSPRTSGRWTWKQPSRAPRTRRAE